MVTLDKLQKGAIFIGAGYVASQIRQIRPLGWAGMIYGLVEIVGGVSDLIDELSKFTRDLVGPIDDTVKNVIEDHGLTVENIDKDLTEWQENFINKNGRYPTDLEIEMGWIESRPTLQFTKGWSEFISGYTFFAYMARTAKDMLGILPPVPYPTTTSLPITATIDVAMTYPTSAKVKLGEAPTWRVTVKNTSDYDHTFAVGASVKLDMWPVWHDLYWKMLTVKAHSTGNTGVIWKIPPDGDKGKYQITTAVWKSWNGGRYVDLNKNFIEGGVLIEELGRANMNFEVI